MKPRLLVVPHVYAENVAVREIELARRLVNSFDVYCLKWNDAVHIAGSSPVNRRWKQFRAAVGAAMPGRQISNGAGGLHFLRTPVLQPILLRRLAGDARSLEWSRRRNCRVLEHAIRDFGFTHVLLGTDKFGSPAGANVFHDLVDWFPEERATPEEVAWTRRRVEEMARCSARLFAVSEPLCEKLKRDFGVNAYALPNGADLAALRGVPRDAVEVIRARWGIRGKYVVGYIGNHGAFSGVDFAVCAFRLFRRQMPDAVLLIVGPAEHWRELLEASREEGVIWTGPVPPAEIAAYFQAIDLGLLAQEKSLGTELAFQIKVVEHSACRRFVVSTPLRTWQRLAWPNVLLTELREEAWAAAMARARNSRWQPEWDALVEPFDWRRIAARAAEVMLGA